MKATISSLTQREAAAAGEQSTIRKRDCLSAARIVWPRSLDAASSCRSRKIGLSLFGTAPADVTRPTKFLGTP
ncbi:MAG: hypothetical protein ABI617_03450 [Sphingomicrobium sp.]